MLGNYLLSSLSFIKIDFSIILNKEALWLFVRANLVSCFLDYKSHGFPFVHILPVSSDKYVCERLCGLFVVDLYACILSLNTRVLRAIHQHSSETKTCNWTRTCPNRALTIVNAPYYDNDDKIMIMS